MVKAVVRWTHLGHGYCFDERVKPDANYRCSPDETLIDHALNEVNREYARGDITEEEAIDKAIKKLEGIGFKVLDKWDDKFLVEAEPCKRYYCVTWSVRDQDVPAIHPKVIVTEAPCPDSARTAKAVCDEIHWGRDLIEKMEEELSSEELREIDRLLDVWEDGHAEAQLDVNPYTGEIKLEDLRITDKWACTSIMEKHPWELTDKDVEECIRKVDKVRRKLKELLSRAVK